MYLILERELREKKITRKMLSKETGISSTSLSLKLSRKRDLTLSECEKIKTAIGFKGSLDLLFATELINGG